MDSIEKTVHQGTNTSLLMSTIFNFHIYFNIFFLPREQVTNHLLISTHVSTTMSHNGH